MNKKYGFLFPGQGSQIVGMGKDFYQSYKESALAFEEASDATHLHLKKLCFESSIEDLTLTSNLQPALFTVEAAIFSALKARTELNPLFSAGHSLGEFSALYSNHSLSVSDGAQLTAIRGKAMQDVSDGFKIQSENKNYMCAVLGSDIESVKKLCQAAHKDSGEVVAPANFNAPGQIVIAGHPDAIAKACDLAKQDLFGKIKMIPLQVSAPFHCELMRPAAEILSKAMTQIHFQTPRFPILSNVTASAVAQEVHYPGLLVSQVTSPVLWEQSMKKGAEMGVELCFEIGPGKVLSGLQKRIIKETTCFNISTVEQLESALKEVFNT